jgi:hypothetical protein
MGNETEVYCSTCFALPGELCRTKFLVYGRSEVMPVVCPTHRARLIDSRREALRYSFARQLLAVALLTFRTR